MAGDIRMKEGHREGPVGCGDTCVSLIGSAAYFDVCACFNACVVCVVFGVRLLL